MGLHTSINDLLEGPWLYQQCEVCVELWKDQKFPLQVQAWLSFTHLMLSFMLHDQLVLIGALWTHHRHKHGWKRRILSWVTKIVSSWEVFGHKVHFVNQKLDFERLVGRKCWWKWEGGSGSARGEQRNDLWWSQGSWSERDNYSSITGQGMGEPLCGWMETAEAICQPDLFEWVTSISPCLLLSDFSFIVT